MNRKAEGFKELNYAFWRMLFVSVMLFTMILVIGSQIKSDINTHDVRSVMFMHRILNSNDGIILSSDYNGRIYPGVVVFNKVSDGNISEQFIIDGDKFSMQATFQREDAQKIAHINKKWFERYYPLAKFEKYEGAFKWRYAVMEEQGNLDQGIALLKTVENEE